MNYHCFQKDSVLTAWMTLHCTSILLENTKEFLYRVEIDSSIAMVRECIYLDSSFHVKLSYESIQITLSIYTYPTKVFVEDKLHFLLKCHSWTN